MFMNCELKFYKALSVYDACKSRHYILLKLIRLITVLPIYIQQITNWLIIHTTNNKTSEQTQKGRKPYERTHEVSHTMCTK